MGLLAEIYVSTPDEAPSYDKSQTVSEEDRAQYSSFTPLELSTLRAIIEGKEWDESMMDSFTCILEREGGERLIHQLPDDLLERLAALDDDAITSASAAWAETEELACEPDDVRPIIADLNRLALRARATGRSVFLWNCV